MTFSLRHLLRQIPTKTLKPFFEAKFESVPIEIWNLETAKLATALTQFLVSDDSQNSGGVIADLARLNPMATEQGRIALSNAAARRTDVLTKFGALENDHERALWMLLEYPELFREGEALRFFDY